MLSRVSGFEARPCFLMPHLVGSGESSMPVRIGRNVDLSHTLLRKTAGRGDSHKPGSGQRLRFGRPSTCQTRIGPLPMVVE